MPIYSRFENFLARSTAMPIFENIELARQLPSYSETKKKNMVLVRFRHVDCGKIFRFESKWWIKDTWKSANTIKTDTREIPSSQIVGVFLKDVQRNFREYTLTRKEDIHQLDTIADLYGQT